MLTSLFVLGVILFYLSYDLLTDPVIYSNDIYTGELWSETDILLKLVMPYILLGDTIDANIRTKFASLYHFCLMIYLHLHLTFLTSCAMIHNNNMMYVTNNCGLIENVSINLI